MNERFLQGIDTVILRVSDVDKSVKWYTEKLELKVLHEDKKLRLVVLDTFGPTNLTLWETNVKIEPDPKSTAYPIFSTANAQAAHEKMKERNIRVGDLITDHVVTYFTFRDPDHNVLEVCQVHS